MDGIDFFGFESFEHIYDLGSDRSVRHDLDLASVRLIGYLDYVVIAFFLKASKNNPVHVVTIENNSKYI